MVKGKSDKIVQKCIKEGFNAGKLDLNPYTNASQKVKFHAWSAGHFDKWGRV